MNGFGGLFSQPLGYIVIRVQVEGVRGYNEEQVALVIPDPTDFGSWVPVTLGTPTINWIINLIKESEIDELSVSLIGSRISHLLTCHQKELSIGSEVTANQTTDPANLNKVVKMIKSGEVCPFLSKIMHAQTKTMYLGSNRHMMMQTLEDGDGPCLPHSLSIMNTYTGMIIGSKWVAVLVKNLTAALVTFTRGVKITWVVAANAIPQLEALPGTLGSLDEMQGIQRSRMSVGQREEVLFQQLDLSCLEGWSPQN